MSNVLGSLVVELNANTAKFTEALGKAASTSRQTSNEISSNFAAMRRAAADLNASLAAEGMSGEKAIAARRNIISLAEKEIALTRAAGLENSKNLGYLKSATSEIERQKNALSGIGPLTNASAAIINAIKLRVSSSNIPGLGGMGGMLALRAYEPVGKMLEKGAGELEEKFGGAALAIGGTVGAIVALGAVAVGVTHHMMDLAQSIENTAAATGLTTAQVQELDEVAKLMDVDAGSLETAFARIDAQIGEFISTGKAAGSGSQLFSRVMKEMGVSVATATGEARPANDVLSDFYDALQRIPDPATRTALAMEALGTRGRVIAQIFEEARREGLSYRDMLEKVDASGNVMGDGQIAMLLEAKGKWDAVKEAASGYWKQLEVIIATATLHPLITAGNLAAFGPAGMAIAEIEAAPKAAQQAQAANERELIFRIVQANEDLDKRVAILRAGGEMQLKLNQAEAAYDAAVAAHAIDMIKGNLDLARQKQIEIDLYDKEISSLKEILALEAKKRDLTAVEKEYEAARQAYSVAAMNGEKEIVAQKARQLAQYDSEITHLKEILHLVQATAFASLKTIPEPKLSGPRKIPSYARTLIPPEFEAPKSGLAPIQIYLNAADAAKRLSDLMKAPAIPAAQGPAAQDISALTGPSITATFDKSIELVRKLHDKWLESTGQTVPLLQEQYNRDLENFRVAFEMKQITAEQFAQAQIELAQMTAKALEQAQREEIEKFGTTGQRARLLLEQISKEGENFSKKIFDSMAHAVDGIDGALAHLVVTGQNSFRQLFEGLAEETLKNSFQFAFASIAGAIQKHTAANPSRPMSEQPPVGAMQGISGTIGKIFGLKMPGMKRDGSSSGSALYVIPVGGGPGGGGISGIATGSTLGGIMNLFKSKLGSGNDSSNPLAGLGVDNSLPNLPKPQESGKAAAAAAAMQTAGSIFKKIWAAKHGDDSSDDSGSSGKSSPPSFGGGGFNFLSLLGMFGGFKAAGGDVTPGKAYIVGENHPEVFVPRAAGRIVPKIETGPGGHSTTVNLHIHGVTDADSFQRSSTQIYSHLHSQLSMAHARNG